ncbi:MAG: chemotaxis protein CheX [bacterium]|nr:chemotaxis protein CheX [bacterium]
MALIGFSGMVKGTAALALPSSTCSAMANRLLGTDESSDEEVSDTISEMVNIVAGAAKSKISESIGEVLELSLPVVLRGESFEVYSPSNAMWLEVPFSSDLGDFTLRLSFEATFATP